MTIGADTALHRIFEAVDAIMTTASRCVQLLGIIAWFDSDSYKINFGMIKMTNTCNNIITVLLLYCTQLVYL